MALELAEIFHRYGEVYRSHYAPRLLPSHQRAFQAISQCRTPSLGGHVFHCPDCDQTLYRYHSCRNRHCPKCQGQRTHQWLQRQQAWLLPVPYFLLTFTLPEALRRIARRQQKLCYSFLFRLAAQATQQLAQDPRFVGGQIGMLGILHTWGRNLSFHPHVHFLVPGGGWDAEGQRWLPARKRFLLPVKALSRIFRAKFREALRRTPWFAEVPPAVWQQAWVVHCQPVGQGQQALGYLARYIFRVALSNHNLLQLDNDQVTFRYRASDTGQLRTCTLSALTFIGRFLQHVLPKGFVKVRYYGLFSPAQRQQLAAARQLLAEVQAAEPPHAADETHTGRPGNSSVAALMEGPDCPSCGRRMTRFRLLQPERGRPP